MILHVRDAAVLDRQDLRPLMRVAVPVGPRERDRDTVVDLLDRVDLIAIVPVLHSPVERGLENLTGLVGPVSGRDGPPESPPPPSAAPLHSRPHQRDERLHVSFTERDVSGPNLIDAHDRHGTKLGSRAATPSW